MSAGSVTHNNTYHQRPKPSCYVLGDLPYRGTSARWGVDHHWHIGSGAGAVSNYIYSHFYSVFFSFVE